MLRRPAVLLLISAGHAPHGACPGDRHPLLRRRLAPLLLHPAAAARLPKRDPFCGASSIISGSRPPTKTFEKKIRFHLRRRSQLLEEHEFRHRAAGCGTLPPRPHGFDHGAVGRLDLRQRLGVGLLCAGRDGKQHFLAQQTPHKLYGDVRLGAPQFLGNRLRRRAVQPESTYSEKRYLVEGRYLHEFLPHAYIGGLVSFEHVRGLKFSDPAYLAGQKQRYTATGVGSHSGIRLAGLIPSPFQGAST